MIDRLQIEADGGSRGNPGPAAYGSVVRNPQTGEILASEGATIGVDTNNVAEYRGVIAALLLAREINPQAIIEAKLDSKLIVEQMSGRWKVKNDNMRRLIHQVHAAFEPSRVKYTWVPREQNKTADALVNAALDGAPSRHIFWERFDGIPVEVAVPDEAPERVVAAKVSLPGFAPDLGEPTRLLVARHGVTAHTLDKRFSGQATDLPLADAGIEQARALALELQDRGGADILISSPVRRARETAEIVSVQLGLDIEFEQGFAEAEFGEWDGYTFAEVKDMWPRELQAWLNSTEIPPPGGESYVQVQARVDRALRRVLDTHAGMRVVVVSHVTPIKTLVGLAIDAPLTSLFKMHMPPCSLTTLSWWADGNSSMSSFGESHHLRHISVPDGA